MVVAPCLLLGLAVAGSGDGVLAERNACAPSATGGGLCAMGVPVLDRVDAIAATSPRDLWFFEFDYPEGEHWDGRAWHRFSPRLPQDYVPYDVTAVGPDVWVAATALSGSSSHTVFARWDGRTWTDHPAPAALTKYSGPQFLPVTPSGGLWAVDGGSSTLERWDGRDWRAVAAPGFEGLTTAAPTSPGPDEVWVTTGTAIDHWTGTAWQQLDIPGGGTLGAPVVGPGGDVWVSRELPDGIHQLLHREGSSWRQVPVTSTLGSFDGQLAADGQGGLWLSVSPPRGTRPTATVDRRGLHGAAGGLVHRTAAGAVTEVAGPRPSYATLAADAPTDERKRLPVPWRDEISIRLLAVIPGTGAVWFSADHDLSFPPLEEEYNEDYRSGSRSLLQRYG
jgi:hypothetical protein